MNIGIDIRSLGDATRTGVGLYTFDLLTALFEVAPQHHYFLFSNGWHSVSNQLPSAANASVTLVSSHIPNKLFHAVSAVFGHPQIDRIMHRRTGQRLDYFFSPNLNITPLSSRVRHIVTIHDLSFIHLAENYTLKQRLWHTLVRPAILCREAATICVPSESTKRDVVETFGIASERVQVLTPGIASSFAQSAAELMTPEKQKILQNRYGLPTRYILGFGTMEPRKNWMGLIAAYRELRQQFPKYELVLAGAAGWKNRALLADIAKTPGVRYIGYVPTEDKAAIYKMASVCVYPSLYEGFGFPVLEAAICGTPVVTSHRTSLPGILPGAVYLVNPTNSSDIARGIMTMLTDTARRDTATLQARTQALSYGWKQAAEILSTLFVQ